MLEMKYDKETRVIVNQSLKDFYNQLLFKSNKIPKELVTLLDINTTFFNNLSPEVR